MNKKLIWYSLPILVGGFLIYKQFSRGKKQGQDVPPPPPPTPTPDPTGGRSVSTYPLRKGSKNSTVGSLQSLLNTALACQNKTLLVVDDNFGSKTETALSSFTAKTSVANTTEFESIKKQLASACSKSSNLSWVWKLIDAQNTGKYSTLVVSQPIQFNKVVKDFRGLWIQAVPAAGLVLNPNNYSLKDFVLRSALTDGALRLEVMVGQFKGMWMSKAGSNLTTLNIS